jgi:hypothetical protein
LKCDFNDSKQPLNPDVVEFRPRRGAAIAAEEQIRAINMYNDDGVTPPSFSEVVGKTRSYSVMARAMTAVGKTNRLKWNFAPR